MRQRLGVNVDHVATVRQARRSTYPSPVEAALAAERAGADQITVHLREDRRHILDKDVQILRQVVQTELNLEMAATQEMVRLALEFQPDTVTLVPERREEVTTEGGLDVANQIDQLKGVVRLLKEGNIRVNMFIDPEIDQIRACRKLDVSGVELHTGRYAEARTTETTAEELGRLVDAAKVTKKLRLFVAAGHGLHYSNVKPIAAIGEILELNIGHSIVARALMDGMDRAVRDMLGSMREAVL